MSHDAPQPVWSKGAADRAAQANVAYCAGRDVLARPAADSMLIEADLWTNRAHAVMLARQGILQPGQAAAILKALEEVRRAADRGEFVIPPESEDVHMAIEQEVTRLAGPGAGGWLHAGRSRNDQTTTDCRIWMRQAILENAREVCALIHAIASHALRHIETPCPGFTHMQPAMITTWGHIAASYAHGLLRDIERLESAYTGANRSPLGAAASFGTSWPIDRELTAHLLGFDEVQENSLDCISSRGESEAQTAGALAMLMNHLSGIGQDLILFSSPPRRWLRLDDRFVTGSSIMPQKRNPDFAEVTRAKAGVVAGMAASLLSIGRSAPAGYNRDGQWTKYLMMDAFAEVQGAPAIFSGVFETLEVDAQAMRQACSEGFMNAAEAADLLARRARIPFRTSYRFVAEAVAASRKKGILQREALNAVLRKNWAEAAPALPGANPKTPYQCGAEDWLLLSDPLELVRSRNQTGSSNPVQTKRGVENVLRKAAEAIKRLDARERLLVRARKVLQREIVALIRAHE